MSRRRAAVKREVHPDPKFGDNVVTKFMNCLMHEGKKSVAEHIVYGAFDRIQKRSGQDRTFAIEFLDPGAQAFVFTFG